jgi:membrane-bound serine protease (ClpP class)
MRRTVRRFAPALLVLATGAAAPIAPLAIASWGPPLLVLAGLLMLAVELFVVPGFGVAGVVGLVAMVAGVLLALIGPFPGAADVVVAVAAIVSSLTMLGVVGWGLATRLRSGHPLLGGILTREDYRAAPARPELQGADGVAVTDLRPAGSAEIAGERLDVVAEGGWVSAGSAVRVVHSEGWRLVVRALPALADEVPEADPHRHLEAPPE